MRTSLAASGASLLRLASCLALLGSPLIAQAGALTVVLKGHVHPAVRESTDLGPADPAMRVERLVLLLDAGPRQRVALERLLHDQQTPGSADFHRWLTPRRFGQRFGVAPKDAAKVQAWLKSQGFRIDAVAAGGRSIVLSGTIGQLERAFGTHIHRLEWRGEKHLAAIDEPRVPATLAGTIRGFASLHDFRFARQSVRRATLPDYTVGGSNYLAPGDFAVIYDVQSLYSQGITGAGRSIAVLGRSSVVAADLSNFRGAFGLSAAAPTIYYGGDGTAPALVSGDETESDLDLEWTGGVAPAATIDFVTSATTPLTDGIILSTEYAVDNNIGDIISLSYGGCESSSDLASGLPFFQQAWQQAAAQGQSVFVSSDDSGAAGCDADSSSTATHGLAVNALCTSPDSTCVGGTEFVGDLATPALYWAATNSATGTSAQQYIGESAWNQSGTVPGGGDLYASGGGASIYYAKPAWQFGAGVPADGHRDVPDVALAASSLHDGYLIYSSDGQPSSTLEAIGGTSCAAPSMAGIAALLAQSMGGRIGNVNPGLYRQSSQQSTNLSGAFHRITSGNNSVPGQSGFSASSSDPVYSQVSGIGSVDAGQLIANWADRLPAAAALVPSSVLVPATETVGTVALTLPSSTAWSAVVAGGASSWLSFTPASGSGSATLSYLVKANTSTASRSATVTIGGQSLGLVQAAAAGTNGAVLYTSSSSLGFAGEAVGTSSAAQQLLVGNSGNSALSLSSISLAGADPGDFALTGSCLTAASLAAGASCALDVVFTPVATGSRSATLQIASNAPSSPAAVALSGTASAAIVGDVPLPGWVYLVLGASLLAAPGLRQRMRIRRHALRR